MESTLEQKAARPWAGVLRDDGIVNDERDAIVNAMSERLSRL
jgi:hypothetical protein